jgi:hypothetical protein
MSVRGMTVRAAAVAIVALSLVGGVSAPALADPVVAASGDTVSAEFFCPRVIRC